MKIVGRGIFWLIDKLVYLLIGRKNFTPTTAPDDWPPDGSMHFLPFDQPIGFTGLPSNTVQYEFAANVGEDDPSVLTLGQEIIFRLCDSRQTLIVFTFDPKLPKHEQRKKAAPPSERMLQFLRSLVPGAHITQNENLAAFLSAGCPEELFSQYRKTPEIPHCFIDFYLFPKKAAPPSPEEGLLQIERGKYQANLYLDCGPMFCRDCRTAAAALPGYHK